MLKNNPALTVTNQVIEVINAGAPFYWDNIEWVEVSSEPNHHVTMSIALINPKAYIESIKKPITKLQWKIKLAIFKKIKFYFDFGDLNETGPTIQKALKYYEALSMVKSGETNRTIIQPAI